MISHSSLPKLVKTTDALSFCSSKIILLDRRDFWANWVEKRVNSGRVDLKNGSFGYLINPILGQVGSALRIQNWDNLGRVGRVHLAALSHPK